MDNSSSGDGHTGWQLTGQEGQGGLPPDVLDAVLHQLDASSRLQVFRTSKLLATALLQRFPRIQLTYPTQHDVLGQDLRELAPFLTKMLQDRQQPTEVLQIRQPPKLHLTLQPAFQLTDAIQQRQNAEPAAAAAEATRLAAWMLGAVPRCGAVNCLTIIWHEDLHLPWEPAFSATLAASFSSLESLTFQGGRISIGHLAKAISHPQLVPKLVHLDLETTDITAHEGQLGRSPFIGSKLQTLRLYGWVSMGLDAGLLSGLLSLPPTLTQLEVTGLHERQWDWVEIAAAVSSLAQLQQLNFSSGKANCEVTVPGPTALLPALAHLPSLHTLVMEDVRLAQEQLTVLLALTQITRLEVHSFYGLTSSRASADCSWRQLKVRVLDWGEAAYLPLHSLTHPLRLHELVKDLEEPSIELLAAAELNLCVSNQAGLVLHGDLHLSKATVTLVTEQYLSRSRRTAQQPLQPSVASSSHSGGVGTSSGQGCQQGGSAAGAQALMQRLGRCVKVLGIKVQGLNEARLPSANWHALAVLFPTAEIGFVQQR